MDAVATLGQRFVDNLCALNEILEQAGLPFAIIGASAFLLHGVDLGRTTRDLDLAVAIEGGLDAIRTVLANAGLVGTSIEHRFKMPDGSEIDILAIDPAWTPTHEIRLADGDRIQAVGLPDAVRRSVEMIFDGCRISVAPLCLLIAVKLNAATADNRPHDLQDACAAMEDYESEGNRRFNIDYEQFEGLTFESAGAFLSGMDTAEAAAEQTNKLVDHAIDELLLSTQLTDRFANGLAYRELVLAYRLGLRESSGAAM